MKIGILKYGLPVFALALCASSAANAAVLLASPEVDPGMAIGAFTLLCGTLAVMRRRRQK